MRARHAGQATRRPKGTIGVLLAPLSGVVVLLAGFGFLLTPSAPAAAAAPAQGWTTTEAPLPPDAGNGSTNPEVYTAGSSCGAPNACVTVGWYHDTGGHTLGLIEQQNQTSWSETEAPQPSNAGTGADQGFWFGSADCGFVSPCRPVACPTSSSCVAVGSYNDADGFQEPVVDTLSGGTWTSQEPPLPSDAASDTTTDHPSDELFSVSCASATACVAVGSYINTSDATVAMIDTLSGTTWSTTPVTTLPPGASGTAASLTGVSCATATSCAAAGFYEDTDSSTNGLLLVLSNGTWTAARAPEGPNPGTDGDGHQFANLTQVVCPSPSVCVGVGTYETATAGEGPLIDTWNGTTWTGQAGPLPANMGGGSDDVLVAVSCGSPTSCAAVGNYVATNGHVLGLIDTLAGGTWTGNEAPQPANVPAYASQESVLYEVSCATAVSCMTVGQYVSSAGETPLVDTWSAGTWSGLAAPLPNGANPGGANAYARTVACDSPVACVVGGAYADTSGNTQGFLDTYTGAQGYWLDASDGGIFTYPNNIFYGSTGSLRLNKPMVGMAPSPDGQGYWLVASDGGIFSYGDALFHGSRGGQPLNKPIVGMAATPDGNGYWLVASDGGIFNYGDAGFFGSRGGQPLNEPIVGMAATPDGGGYWLVASDGGIFGYGDALFYGSTGSLHLNKPVVGMAATPSGLGYWLVASDGGIFNYGDANFYGSTGSLVLNKPVVGMAASPSGKGYWLAASDGGIFNYGDAPFQGSAGSLHLNAPVVGMAGG
jgi:hypothetical protein